MSARSALEGTNVPELADIARAAIRGGLAGISHRDLDLRNCAEYAAGRGGIPEVEDGASDELKDLAKLARLGMCRVALRTFLRGLSVIGYRSPDASDDDPAWAWWQAHRLDARQVLAHRPALTFGESYVSLLPHDPTGDPARPAFWNPRNAHLEYAVPGDAFPAWALLTRGTAGQGRRAAFLVDDKTVTPVVIDRAPSTADADGNTVRSPEDLTPTGVPWEHGATYDGKPVCPVVRFVDDSDDDERAGRGVVDPLIDLNRAMNQVNFDRLVVARFGAYDQKVIIGWTAPKDRLVKMSASHISAINEHPEDVRIDRWQASPLAPYNELIREMREQVALEAAIPLWATGTISNVSTDTVAMIEAAHQRELGIKRDSFGESWEMVLRLAVAMSGGTQPSDEAEIVWRDTNARTFGAVIDGISKLAVIPADSQGVPIEEMLDLIPGMSQQRIKTIADALRRRRSSALVAGLLNRQPQAATLPPAAPTQLPPVGREQSEEG